MSTLTYAGGLHDGTKSRTASKGETDKVRVQFDLPPRSMERLLALKEKTEAASYAEVIRNALQIYEALIVEAEGGKEFLTKSKDGIVSPIRIFL